MNLHNDCEEDQKHLPGSNKVQIQYANVQWFEVSKVFLCFLFLYWNISHYYCSTVFFDQINADLVSISDFFQKS